MASHDSVRFRRRPAAGRRSRLTPILFAVTAMIGAAGGAIVSPPSANAIICVGIGRIIGISDCFGGGYGHFPPPRGYAPLPEDYPPPPPPPATPTTTAPPPAP